MPFGRSGRRDDNRDDDRPHEKIAQGDTFAWLRAAFGVLAPILAVLIVVILAAYGVVHLLFLR